MRPVLTASRRAWTQSHQHLVVRRFLIGNQCVIYLVVGRSLVWKTLVGLYAIAAILSKYKGGPQLFSVKFSQEQSNNNARWQLPQNCSQEQLDMISFQLGTMDAIYSMNHATRCHTARQWLDDFFKQQHSSHKAGPFLGIHLGCNKGFGALNALRMGSGNAAYDKTTWRSKFWNNVTNVRTPNGACGQGIADQFVIPNNTQVQPATVHCVEAMPSNYRQLNDTVNRLGFQDALVVRHAAMSNRDGGILVRDHTDTVGIWSCSSKNIRLGARCRIVPQYKLDTYIKEVGAEGKAIDFLSVDVERFDWDVLSVASKTLSHVKYLEFEYLSVGTWGSRIHLSTAINTLQEQGFWCYWAGANGHIWRITGCVLPYYNQHTWSNVACVNTKLADPLLMDDMEALFRQTLALVDRLGVKYKKPVKK